MPHVPFSQDSYSDAHLTAMMMSQNDVELHQHHDVGGHHHENHENSSGNMVVDFLMGVFMGGMNRSSYGYHGHGSHGLRDHYHGARGRNLQVQADPDDMITDLDVGDHVGFSFFVIAGVMLCATIFFFIQVLVEWFDFIHWEFMVCSVLIQSHFGPYHDRMYP